MHGGGAGVRVQSCIGGLLAVWLALVPGRSQGGAGTRRIGTDLPTLGIYFDSRATQCTGPLQPFGWQHLFMCGYPPADSLLVGVRFNLELPVGVHVEPDSTFLHRNIVLEPTGDWRNLKNVDLQFVDCMQLTGPVVLLEFAVYDTEFTGPRPDLVVRLKGTAVDSLLLRKLPQWKVCSPEDPFGYRTLMDAPPVNAVFNCTQACSCTTAVSRQTWAAVKALYQGR